MQPRLKVAVNARFLIKDKLEGIGYFTQETLKRITQKNPTVDFYFLFDRPYCDEFIFSENVHPVVLFPPARHPFLWFWWFEISVKKYLATTQPDLFLSPDGFVSLQSKTPTLAVQHDIAFEHFQKSVSFLTLKYYQYFVPKFMQKATRIATVSTFSKNDLIQTYQLSAEKIDVVYSASKSHFVPTNANEQQKIREKFTNGNPFLLFVGSINARKNVKNMLLAFEDFKSKNDCHLKFVIAGAEGWKNEEMKTIYKELKFKNEIIFIGRQPLEDLVKIIGSAQILMYVSLFEGFGVPPLEGMQCHVPVISSTSSSLPEVCGDAAMLVNPNEIKEISEAISYLVQDENLRKEYVQKGILQSQKFTWDRCADLLWESCLKTIGNKN